MQGLLSILSLFSTSLINSIIQEQEFRFCLLYDIKTTLKSHFSPKKDKILSLCSQRYYGRHNDS